MFLSQDGLPAAERLAKYDLVVVDSEWAHRVDRSWFDELRRLDPQVIILAYVNLVDEPLQLGTESYYENRYALWQFQSPTSSSFPREWQARTASGGRVSQYQGAGMANLSDVAPRVNGQSYAEYASDWIADRVWSTGLWDGIFLDVWGDRIYDANPQAWDVAANGTDVPEAQIYGADGPWERGVTAAETLMRKRMPGAVLVANGDRTMRDGLLDGRAWESFADVAAERDPAPDLQGYVSSAAAGAHRTPGVTLTINARRPLAGSPEDYRDARFFVTGSLLQNGFWAPAVQGYDQLSYYDELDGGGAGRGYLGAPVVADPDWSELEAPFANGIGSVADHVYRRDFARGIVINNSSDADQHVLLGGTFRKLRGTQDPAANDGSMVDAVTVPARDGVILLRAMG